MPRVSSQSALALLARTEPSLPAIIVSGAAGEEMEPRNPGVTATSSGRLAAAR